MIFIIIIDFIPFFMNETTVYGVGATGQDPINKVLSSSADVPDGIKNISEWFNIPTLNSGSNTNTTAILSPKTGDNQTNQDIVRITQYGSANAYGAVWSKRNQADENQQNYIDITKNQSVSMWVFFGGGPGRNNQNTGEGMAFVLQNVSDSVTNNSTSSIYMPNDPAGVGGETMGVWGSYMSNGLNTPVNIANRAIHDSWALEFDTHVNDPDLDNGTDKSGFFDHGIFKMNNSNYYNHIASGFPGESSTYDSSDETNGPMMNHSSLVYNPTETGSPYFLTNGTWHHLTITWLPKNSPGNSNNYPEVRYGFNDKNPSTGAPQTGISHTIPIVGKNDDGTANNDPFELKDNSNKLYWGFTGSVAGYTHSENNLIIFESIPSIAEGIVTATVYDNTQKRTVAKSYDNTYTGTIEKPDNVDTSVNNNDNISLKYRLSYESGSQPWNTILSNINLPEHITYQNATISYNDSTTPDESIALTGNQTNITHTLAKALDKTNNTSATITINGIANGGTSASTTVDPAHASFDGNVLFKDINTPTFTIVQPKELSLKATDPISKDINIGSSTTLGGQVSYTPASTIDSSKIKIHRIINGIEDTDAPTLSTLDSGSSADIFNFPVAASELKDGANKVEFYAEDDYHNRSNTISYTVNVNGSLLLTVANSSHFKDVQSFPFIRTIPRANDWTVDITDERAVSSSWTLQAEATTLTNESNSSQKWTQGGIVYVDSNGNHIPVNSEAVNIANGTKNTNDAQVFHVGSNWATNRGILLDQKVYEPRGTYKTTITWTAIDGLQNLA